MVKFMIWARAWPIARQPTDQDVLGGQSLGTESAAHVLSDDPHL
jgi:hypothetical protein